MSSPQTIFIFVGTISELRLSLIPALERKAKLQVVRCPNCYAICESPLEQRCILFEGCCTECCETPEADLHVMKQFSPISSPLAMERIPWPHQR